MDNIYYIKLRNTLSRELVDVLFINNKYHSDAYSDIYIKLHNQINEEFSDKIQELIETKFKLI